MEDFVKGWKNIADYLKIDTKTAMKYYKIDILPVKYNPAGHPVITKRVLDKWQMGAK